MTIKQFLEPDWRKIVIFVLLFILLLFIYLFIWSFPGYVEVDPRFICCRNIERENDLCNSLVNSTEWGNSTTEICAKYERDMQEKNIFFLSDLIIILILSYIFSCLIVWIYEKAKKKK